MHKKAKLSGDSISWKYSHWYYFNKVIVNVKKGLHMLISIDQESQGWKRAHDWTMSSEPKVPGVQG